MGFESTASPTRAAAPSGVKLESTSGRVTPAIARTSMSITSSPTRRPLGNPAASPAMSPRRFRLRVLGGITMLSRR